MLTTTQRNSPPGQTAIETHTLFRPECERAITMPFTPKPPPADPTAGDIINALDKHGVVFLTGKAGTGKTYLARQVYKLLKSQKKNVIACAPTGTAVHNFGDGETIHHAFKFPIVCLKKEVILNLLDNLEYDVQLKSKINSLSYLIIDEVSMVRIDTMLAIHFLCLRAKGDRGDIHFGGIKVLLCGDLHQLAPIVKGDALKAYFIDAYGSRYFFKMPIFQRHPLKILELTKIYRQNEDVFIDILDRMRTGSLTDSDIKMLNQRVGQEIPVSTILSCTNARVKEYNNEHLQSLSGKSWRYNATLLKGEFENPPYVDILRLKHGAKVMLTRNISNENDGITHPYYNGTLGTFDREKTFSKGDEIITNLVIRVKGEELHVSIADWEEIEYQFNRETKKLDSKISAEAKQYPIILAAALTIHRAQGKTLDGVTFDISSEKESVRTWEHGHLYTALSRGKSLDSLSLVSAIQKKDAICDIEVRRFMESSHLY